jgi:hypothetical protein
MIPDLRYRSMAALLLSCVSTIGYSQSQGVFVIGMGDESCGKYLSAVHNQPPGKYRVLNRRDGEYYDEHMVYVEWLKGFLTALNLSSVMAGKDNITTADNAAIDVWIRRWCEQNPTKKLIEAVLAFTKDQRR